MISVAADVGGTFTDLVLADGSTGRMLIDKVPSTPGSGDAVVRGIRRLARAADVPVGSIDVFIHGFTIATNAWLTRSGANVVLATTRGFRDILEIATQRRPLAYSLTQPPREPIVPRSRVVEVDERLDAFGRIVAPLSAEECERVAAAIAAHRPEAVAISLLFSYLDATHEEWLAAVLRERLPNVPVYLASRINPQIEEYPRTNTTVVSAYVGPAVDRYLGMLERDLPGAGMTAPLLLMRSDGGIATSGAAREQPGSMLLSGPAGGVMAGLEVSRVLGVPDLVTFDMGGTSADFALIEGGRAQFSHEREHGGERLRLPSIDIHTISAGGGSIGHVDLGGAIRVGPESAGAVPGPACYGLGGTQPTLTDAALVLGWLSSDEYLGGEMTLDLARARESVATAIAQPLGISVEDAAFAMVAIANANMAVAVRAVSVERGHDVRQFSLLAFGGAGAIFAPFLARDLEMREIIVPPRPGVFSAAGLLVSDIRYALQAPLRMALDGYDADTVARTYAKLQRQADLSFERDKIEPARRRLRRLLDVRYIGQVHELTVEMPARDSGDGTHAAAIAAAFHRAHERAYGFADAAQPCEIVNLRLEATGAMPKPRIGAGATTDDARAVRAARRRTVYLGPRWGSMQAEVVDRAALEIGATLSGPAIAVQLDTTTLVLPGQRLRVDDAGMFRIGVA